MLDLDPEEKKVPEEDLDAPHLWGRTIRRYFSRRFLDRRDSSVFLHIERKMWETEGLITSDAKVGSPVKIYSPVFVGDNNAKRGIS